MSDFMKWLYAHYIRPQLDAAPPDDYETVSYTHLDVYKRQVVGVAGAAALFHGHDDLLGDLGEGDGALGVGRALGLLDIMPFGMSGHGTLLSLSLIHI